MDATLQQHMPVPHTLSRMAHGHAGVEGVPTSPSQAAPAGPVVHPAGCTLVMHAACFKPPNMSEQEPSTQQRLSATYVSVGTVLGQMPKLPAVVPHSSMLAEGCHAKLLAGAGSWRTATWAHRHTSRQAGRTSPGREGGATHEVQQEHLCRCWRCCCVLGGLADSAGGWHTDGPLLPAAAAFAPARLPASACPAATPPPCRHLLLWPHTGLCGTQQSAQEPIINSRAAVQCSASTSE